MVGDRLFRADHREHVVGDRSDDDRADESQSDEEQYAKHVEEGKADWGGERPSSLDSVPTIAGVLPVPSSGDAPAAEFRERCVGRP